ncbi:MAG: Rne/Rng family ribonuclease [Syntrophobacterales bacterium]|nr:Rne/Rng family ribonuclease [Syntrophobacterales bacterium]
MSKKMLINAVHTEQKRMAIVEDGKLVEFNIQMAVRDPITGNLYKGIVMKVERGLQAAFVNYGGKKDGFLPLRDVSSNNYAETNGSHEGPRQTLKPGQEILVQVLREVSERKGALLTSYISLPGRYLVMLPNKESSGISRKIEDEDDRKRLKELIEQIKTEEGMGFIVRTAGMNRTKQELSRDYQHLFRLWTEIQKKAAELAAPALIYQESAFGVRSLRDYFTTDIDEILVDDAETFRQMKTYCKAVAPRNLKIIKLDKEKTPLFDKHQLEEQIRVIYQERADLKSGGYLIINPTEAMITIDVNSGRGSHKRNVEETAYQTNLEAAEEIARQLRLRDLGGLIAIDFIDMMDQKHNAEVEKAFKKALTMDRSRIQLAHISKFGILELSRQKKQSTIQEISYTACPYCHGRGMRPSLEYIALNAYRKVETQAVKGLAAEIKASVHNEIADYLQNQKRAEISRLEADYDLSIHIYGSHDATWEECKIEATKRDLPLPSETAQSRNADAAEKESKEAEELAEAEGLEEETEPEIFRNDSHEEEKQKEAKLPAKPDMKKRRPSRSGKKAPQAPPERQETTTTEKPAAVAAIAVAESSEPKIEPALEPAVEPAKKKSRRRPRRRRKTPADLSSTTAPMTITAAAPPEEKRQETEAVKPPPPAPTKSVISTQSAARGAFAKNRQTEKKEKSLLDDPLNKLKKVFEEFDDND